MIGNDHRKSRDGEKRSQSYGMRVTTDEVVSMTGDILAFRFQNLHECYLLFVWSSKSKPPRATEWVTWPAKRSRFLVAILWFDPCGAILSSRPQTLCAARVERRSRTRISRAR